MVYLSDIPLFIYIQQQRIIPWSIMVNVLLKDQELQEQLNAALNNSRESRKSPEVGNTGFGMAQQLQRSQLFLVKIKAMCVTRMAQNGHAVFQAARLQRIIASEFQKIYCTLIISLISYPFFGHSRDEQKSGDVFARCILSGRNPISAKPSGRPTDEAQWLSQLQFLHY